MKQQSRWPDHTHSSSSQPRRVGEPPVVLTSSQEYSFSSLERCLSKSITRLAFCMGFSGGLVLLFMGVQLYDSFLPAKGGFHVVTPVVDDLLLPLSFIAMGILAILRWKVHLLSKQLSAVQRQAPPSQDGLGPFLLLSPFGITGFFFIFAGGQLTWRHLPVLAVILVVGALSFLGAALFFSPPHP